MGIGRPSITRPPLAGNDEQFRRSRRLHVAPVKRQQGFRQCDAGRVPEPIEGAGPVQHDDPVALRQEPLQRTGEDVQGAVEA